MTEHIINQKYPHFTQSLWSNNQAPLGNGTSETAFVELTVFPVNQQKDSEEASPVCIICPGGGYTKHAMTPEGYNIAKWLNNHGIAGVVLKYRLPQGGHQVPLIDLQRAIRLTRHSSTEWNINPQKLGVMGFSAGGHVAAMSLTAFERSGELNDEIDQEDCRPNFGLLLYPLISLFIQLKGQYSFLTRLMVKVGNKIFPKLLFKQGATREAIEQYCTHLNVTSDTPPTFLAHALNDVVVPSVHSKLFYDALIEKGVNAHFLKRKRGGHTFNFFKGPNWRAWQKSSIDWLHSEKLI